MYRSDFDIIDTRRLCLRPIITINSYSKSVFYGSTTLHIWVNLLWSFLIRAFLNQSNFISINTDIYSYIVYEEVFDDLDPHNNWAYKYNNK